MREFLLNNLVFILVVLFLIFSFIRGVSLGLVKTVLSFAMIIVAIVVTKIITPFFVLMVKDYTNIEATISDAIYESFIKTNLFNNTTSGIAGKIIGTTGLTESMKNMAMSISNVILNAGCGIILFFVVFIVLKILFRVLDVIDYIPVVGEINKLLGGIFGVGEAIVIIWLLFALFKALSNNVEPIGKIVNQINQNFFIKFLYDNNAIYNFFASLFGGFVKAKSA